jgi:hypothetical protein
MKRAVMFVAAVVLLGVQVQQAQATVACCRVFANGAARTFGSFKCNLSGVETRRLGVGTYEVDFQFTDVRGWAKSATPDNQTTGTPVGLEIAVADRSGDVSSVFVTIRRGLDSDILVDQGFDLCLH